jgi:hypothetical protein
MAVNVFLLVFMLSSLLTTEQYESVYKVNDTVAENTGTFFRPDVIYGLVHVAKTAGTEINGELANHFEQVCGNKGYSYDAFQLNKRFSGSGAHDVKANLGDLVSKAYSGHNRGKVPAEVMGEIGFEDCDYISMERGWKLWKQFRVWSMELHVPCRDPLGHLMSQCNYKQKTFNCKAANLGKEIGRCMIAMNRFSHQLANQPNISLKCFDSIPPHNYIEYMGHKLQRKRIESDYVHRSSNRPRDKEQECIWDSPDVASAVEDILLSKYDYYRFCDQCLGSKNDILATGG